MLKLNLILIFPNPSEHHFVCLEQNKVNMPPCKNIGKDSDKDSEHDKVHFLT